MTARDLQVGDVIYDDFHKAKYTLQRIDENFMFSATMGWLNWNGELHPHIKSVHRPQPDGTLKQVFPGVEG